MTIIRSKELPHCFCPDLAKEHGLAVAIVEFASRDLSRGQDPDTHEEINIEFEEERIFTRCFYLSKDEINKAIIKLNDLGIFSSEISQHEELLTPVPKIRK